MIIKSLEPDQQLLLHRYSTPPNASPSCFRN